MNKLKNNYLAIPIIKTKRLILDYPLEKDFENLQKFLKSNRSKYIGGPYTDFTSWSDYMANLGHWSLYGYGLWSVRTKNDNKFIGRAGIIKPPIFTEPDLAWQLFENFEGNGYAYEAAKIIKEYAINNFNLTNLASHILEGNIKSITLAEKLSSNKKKIKINKRIFIVYYYK